MSVPCQTLTLAISKYSLTHFQNFVAVPFSDVNKDWTCKDKDMDKNKDLNHKDQDKDKDLNLALTSP